MNTITIQTIMRKDLKEVMQNRGVWVPAVIVPMLFLVLLPLGVILVPTHIEGFNQWLASPQGYIQIQQHFASFMADVIQGLNPYQALIVIITGYMLAPFLLIMPLMLSTIIGAESFVGEKERKTLEALIYTPASDAELFLGKVMASLVPAVLLTWFSFIVYAVVVNAASYSIISRIWFPPATWWPLMLWLTPAVATLGMAFTVLISVKTNTFMEAYQMSASLVVLVVGLVLGQISGVLFLSFGIILLLGLLIWILDAIMIGIGIKTFARSSLLSRI